jgi:hypothetical protein
VNRLQFREFRQFLEDGAGRFAFHLADSEVHPQQRARHDDE